MDHSSSPQNPRERRSNVLLAASIECRGSHFPVRLSNLSPQGALVVGTGLPIQGTTVMFCRNDLRVRSHVAWLDGDNAGIAFSNRSSRRLSFATSRKGAPAQPSPPPAPDSPAAR